jgi:hypothetical protein
MRAKQHLETDDKGTESARAIFKKMSLEQIRVVKEVAKCLRHPTWFNTKPSSQKQRTLQSITDFSNGLVFTEELTEPTSANAK